MVQLLVLTCATIDQKEIGVYEKKYPFMELELVLGTSVVAASSTMSPSA